MASDNSSVNGSKMFKMENVDLAAYKKVNIEVNEGEILVFQQPSITSQQRKFIVKSASNNSK